jgi:SecD/SecF fusion protein
MSSLLLAVLVLAGSIALGYFLSQRWRMPEYSLKITTVIFAFFAGLVVCVFSWNNIKLGIDLRGGSILVYQVQDTAKQLFSNEGASRSGGAAAGDKKDINMSELVAAVSRRINPGGQKEVTVRQLGARQVEIIVPEVNSEEIAQLEGILSSVGSLEFRILATPYRPNYKTYMERGRQLPPTENQLRDDKGEVVAWWVNVAEGRENEFAPLASITATREVPYRGKMRMQVLVVKDKEDVTGDYLNRARAGFDNGGRPAVDFHFKPTGAAKFGRLTGTHLPIESSDAKFHLAVILDDEIYSAPSIISTIHENGQITGEFTPEEVEKYAQVLNSGALPAALSREPVAKQIIGPTLGQDTIERGINSLLISVTVVFISVLFYYHFAGVVACLALTMNGLLLLAIMIGIKAPFTLPGLAGFALTIGMAVDANVLIYERMREEAARGAGLRMVIRNGFERALSAIVDSNLTTLITAVVLYAIGSDQVRGFAVTLFLGIVLSMFSAIFCARVVFDVAERRHWIEKVSMMRALGETHINFLGHKWVFIGLSIFLITIGAISAAARGRGILDIDFTGGVSLEILFKSPQKIADVRAKLEQTDLPDVVVSDVAVQGEQTGLRFKVNTSTPSDQQAEEFLRNVREDVTKLFGNELERNALAVDGVATITSDAPPATSVAPAASAKPAEKSAAKPAEKPAEKPAAKTDGKQSQWRVSPSLHPMALLVSQAILGQADKSPAPPAGKDKEAPKAAEKPTQAAAPATPAAPAPAQAAPATPAASPSAASPAPVAAVGSTFVGGTKATLKFAQAVNHGSLEVLFRSAITKVIGQGRAADVRMSNPDYVKDPSARPYKEWEVQILLPVDEAQKVFGEVRSQISSMPHFPSSNTVGGVVAEVTRNNAMLALLVSAVCILIYLWVRFQRFTYGIGAVVSLVHDVAICVGMVAVSFYVAPLLGFLMIEPFKINLTLVTAFLTVAGYSLNDTIVIFDRIREVRGKAPRVSQDMINLSINQTLGRTFLTGLTSLMVIITLYILGGPTIHGFAFAMIVGVVTGTYSSIYIASPFLLWVSGKAEKTART